MHGFCCSRQASTCSDDNTVIANAVSTMQNAHNAWLFWFASLWFCRALSSKLLSHGSSTVGTLSPSMFFCPSPFIGLPVFSLVNRSFYSFISVMLNLASTTKALCLSAPLCLSCETVKEGCPLLARWSFHRGQQIDTMWCGLDLSEFRTEGNKFWWSHLKFWYSFLNWWLKILLQVTLQLLFRLTFTFYFPFLSYIWHSTLLVMVLVIVFLFLGAL